MKLIKRIWQWLFKRKPKATSAPVDASADELHLATIGAILINELYKSRALRKKIRGTNLETQLKKILKS
jgi:hypothetical protein